MDVLILYLLMIIALFILGFGLVLLKGFKSVIFTVIGIIGTCFTLVGLISVYRAPSIIAEEPYSIQSILPNENGPDVIVYLDGIPHDIYSFVAQDEDGVVQEESLYIKLVKLIIDDTNCVKRYYKTRTWWVFQEKTDIIELHISKDEIQYKR